ncbi:MAG: hypothetical protein ABS46_14090 [Cytophagaceae bacterium SCN 52-12]|nr:MAG: hypothetical protein ABS46_14090 [Cytophagaceae bacterium SCN 52-12]
MKRDGHNTSIWQGRHESYQPVNSGGWNRDKVYDALIVGGGVTGLTTGILLQKAGFDCLLAEAHTVGFGTSLGTTAHLNTLMDTSYPVIEQKFGAEAARLVARGTARAIALAEELSSEMETYCGYSRRRAWLVAETEEEQAELKEILHAALRAGLDAREVFSCPVSLPFGAGCCFEDQAQVDAGAYLWGLAEIFEEYGGVILENCLVDEVNRSSDYQVADTAGGPLKARRLIYATHIPPGVNQYSVLCAPYRSYAMAFTLRDGHYPEGLVYDMKDPYNYFRTQRIDGQDYVIAGGLDHKTGHHQNTAHIFTELEAMVRKYFQVSEIAYRWSSQYYEPADGLPYIGRYPGKDETFLATGFSGNGFTYGTLSAILLSELIVEGRSDFEKLFSPSRIKPVASAKNLIRENADVVKEWFSGLAKDQKIALWADLAPGEARVVEWEGKSLAVYKSGNGRIYAVEPVCPHLGCKVGWNSTEKSWDCPCHGSRFSYDGTLLTGPAVAGLRGYDVEV